jgi:2-phospho-L-lactate guanylyltransferase
VVEARKPAPSLTTEPARDEPGSKAMLCSPPLVMPFPFGDNNYFPHLATARSLGIEPTIFMLPSIGLDIDQPENVEAFLNASPQMTMRAYRALRGGRGTTADEIASLRSQ